MAINHRICRNQADCQDVSHDSQPEGKRRGDLPASTAAVSTKTVLITAISKHRVANICLGTTTSTISTVTKKPWLLHGWSLYRRLGTVTRLAISDAAELRSRAADSIVAATRSPFAAAFQVPMLCSAFSVDGIFVCSAACAFVASTFKAVRSEKLS